MMRFIYLMLIFICTHTAYAIETRGVIAGKLAFPGESIPIMKICAENVDTKKIICTQLTSKEYNEAKYHWELPTGKYFIFAKVVKPQGQITPTFRAYYSEFITCGEQATCSSHKPILVTVESNKTLNNINPTDWYQQDH